jgi:hypothetical protein
MYHRRTQHQLAPRIPCQDRSEAVHPGPTGGPVNCCAPGRMWHSPARPAVATGHCPRSMAAGHNTGSGGAHSSRHQQPLGNQDRARQKPGNPARAGLAIIESGIL